MFHPVKRAAKIIYRGRVFSVPHAKDFRSQSTATFLADKIGVLWSGLIHNIVPLAGVSDIVIRQIEQEPIQAGTAVEHVLVGIVEDGNSFLQFDCRSTEDRADAVSQV